MEISRSQQAKGNQAGENKQMKTGRWKKAIRQVKAGKWIQVSARRRNQLRRSSPTDTLTRKKR